MSSRLLELAVCPSVNFERQACISFDWVIARALIGVTEHGLGAILRDGQFSVLPSGDPHASEPIAREGFTS